MANVIIPDQERRKLAERIGRDHHVDMRDPAMREAAEIAAARTKEAVGMIGEKRRYF